MPIAAIATIGMGASAIAAGGLSTFGMISAIGGIVGGIGALTKSKELTMLGGVAALAGGVGALAQNRGWLAAGDGASALSDPSSNISGMLQETAPGLQAQDYGAAAGSNNVELGLMDSGPVGQVNAQATPSGNIASAIADAAPTGSPGGMSGPPISKAALDGTSAFGANSAPGAFQLGGTQSASSGGIFDIFRKFDSMLPKDQETRRMLFNLIGGAFDENKSAQTDLFKARAETERTQLRNGSDVPRLQATLTQRSPMFPAARPTYNAPRMGGLMNAG